MKPKQKLLKLFKFNISAVAVFVAVFSLLTAGILVKPSAKASGVPYISISNSKIVEGDSGSRTMNFAVTLSEPSTSTVTVYYNAGNLGASNNAKGVSSLTTAGGDFLGKKNTKLSFSAGQVQKTIAITIIGDTVKESDEIFTVNLSNAVGANFMDQYGTGTIIDDDSNTGLKLGIGDASFRASTVNNRTVTVPITLSTAQAVDVYVSIQTIAGTAKGVKTATTTGGDYVSQTKTIKFPAGSVYKPVTLTIFPNTIAEGTRTFTIKLSSASGTIVRDTATVTLRDPNATYTRAGRSAGPPRIALVGDSVTGNYEYFAKEVLEYKGASVLLHGEPATSILDANKCNGQWANQILAEDPDIVVFENIGNYKFYAPCSPEVTQNSPEYFAQWQYQAQLNTNILTSKGAQFFWIINPSVSSYYDPSWWAEIPTLNSIYTTIASNTANTHTIDAWAPFGGDPPDCSLRDADSVVCLHLNPAGQLLMTSLVQNALAPYLQ